MKRLKLGGGLSVVQDNKVIGYIPTPQPPQQTPAWMEESGRPWSCPPVSWLLQTCVSCNALLTGRGSIVAHALVPHCACGRVVEERDAEICDVCDALTQEGHPRTEQPNA